MSVSIVRAQQPEPALSDAEVNMLRDLAQDWPRRLLAFAGFLDGRARELVRLSEGKRQPGREEDLRDQYTQFASIADDLDDNLDDASRRHRDVRKVLPRLIAACERWNTQLNTPPADDRYRAARALAPASLSDVREQAVAMVEEQKMWFAAHPPEKDAGGSEH